MNSSKTTNTKQPDKCQNEDITDDHPHPKQDAQVEETDDSLPQDEGVMFRDVVDAALNGVTDTTWRAQRDLLLETLQPIILQRAVMKIIEAMDDDNWQVKKAKIYDLLGIAELPPLSGVPCMADIAPLSDVPHMADIDPLNIVWYKQDPLEPVSWKSDLPKAHTVFGMGCEGVWNFDGVPTGQFEWDYEEYFKIQPELRMSKFEAQIRYCLGKQILQLADYPVGVNTDIVPRNVSESDWKKAVTGDAKAIRAANKSHPSCIYHNLYTLAHIHRHTVLATLSPQPKVASESRDWLKTALLTFVDYSRRNGVKDTPRPVIGPSHLTVFWKVFHDIEMVRVIAHSVHNSVTLSARRLLTLLPELGLLDGNTSMGADRRAWSNLIVGYTIRNDAPLVKLDARESAITILADVTGFKPRHVYECLQKLHGGDLRSTLAFHRKEAKSAAAEILRQN